MVKSVVKSELNVKLSVDTSQKGIWKYTQFLSPVPQKYRLSLNEGETGEEYVQDLGIIFKREDQNPTGSLKDRGLAYLVSRVYSEGKKNLVIPSSGNAAISAGEYCRLAGLELKIFLSPQTDKRKLKKIDSYGFEVFLTKRPLSESFRIAKTKNYFNIRPSVNPFGSEGYQTISFEIIQHYGQVDDIFIPVSSGSCLVGVYQGFARFGLLPRIHLCQPAAVSPLASLFDKDYSPERRSVATAIVAKSVPLREKVVEAVKRSLGTGWVIENSKITGAQKLLEKRGIVTSNEGALTLAAVLKAREKGWKLGKTICLLTGRRY